MSTATDSLPTRETLLGRLRDLNDQESWRDFFDRYWRLLYNVARRSGLADPDAQDVVQETVIGVAQRMPSFQYDRQRGSFKQWLLRITHRRIMDHLRKTYRQPRRAELGPEALEERLTTLADSADAEFERTWDQEWERARFASALGQVRRQANPKHFQVFEYCVVQGWPVSKVAATLGISAAQVYLAKHRITLAVKRVVRKLRDDERL